MDTYFPFILVWSSRYVLSLIYKLAGWGMVPIANDSKKVRTFFLLLLLLWYTTDEQRKCPPQTLLVAYISASCVLKI
jgi:hypothetical protein